MKHEGVSLIELVVVIAILGITAAAVVPAFARAAQEDEVTRAAGALESILGMARRTALERAVRVRVTLVPETGSYWVQLEIDDDHTVLDSGRVILASGVRLSSPAARPEFRVGPLGVMDGDSLLVLGPGGARAITWERWTGAIRAEAR